VELLDHDRLQISRFKTFLVFSFLLILPFFYLAFEVQFSTMADPLGVNNVTPGAQTPFLDDKTPDQGRDSSQDETDKEEAPPVAEPDKSLKFVAVKYVGHASDKNSRYRRVMEDEHIMMDQFGGVKDQALFAVYDGHGGRGTVEYVAKNLHEILKTQLESDPNVHPLEAIKKTFNATDTKIAENKIQFSGCTAVVAFIRVEKDGKRKLYTANVGDARAVLVRNGVSQRLTYDHKGNDESEVKRIVSAGGFVIMNRVNGMLAVTRSLGDITMKDVVISEPFTQEIELQPTDTHLIIACDGLWDVTSDQDSFNLIQNEPSAQKASEKLLIDALKNGSTDNISVVVVFL